MNEQEILQRLARLEARVNRIDSVPGLTVQPDLDTLGQNTQIEGDLTVTGSTTNGDGWTAYTATVQGSAGSAGTYAEDNVVSKYRLEGGHTCHVIVTKRVTSWGSWTGTISIALPFAPAGEGTGGVAGWIIGTGSLAPKAYAMVGASINLAFYDLWGSSNLTVAEAAANDYINLRFEYQI